MSRAESMWRDTARPFAVSVMMEPEGFKTLTPNECARMPYGLQRSSSAQPDRAENPGRVGLCLRAGMPALRQTSRDFLGSDGPTLGVSPTISAEIFPLNHAMGA